jgi:hypothetical protein
LGTNPGFPIVQGVQRESQEEKDMSIFKRKKPPGMELPFIHGTDCPIVRADPGYQPTWEKAEEGDAWRRICQCGSETIHVTDAAKKIDPYEPGTFRHAPQCDYRDVTDPAIIRAILTVKPGSGSDEYLWVTCGHCEISWPVPDDHLRSDLRRPGRKFENL